MKMNKQPSSHPPSSDNLKRAQDRADQILTHAIKSSQDLLVRAELEGVKQVAQQKLQFKKVEDEYLRSFADLLSKVAQNLNTQISLKQQETERTLNALSQQLNSVISNREKEFADKNEQFRKEQEKIFFNFSEAAKAEIKQQIENEMRQTKGIIEQYKQSRLKAIEDNLVDLVGQTALKTLGKTLSFEDQTDLVLKALEEAKEEGFLN